MSIFKVQELKKPSVFQKVLKRSPKENAIIEINNLLAQNEDKLEELQLEDIANITKKYKLNLGKKFKSFRLELFQQYVDYCLEDKRLDEDEIRSFEHLKNLLFLSDSEIKQIITRKSEQIFQKETQKQFKTHSWIKKKLKYLKLLKMPCLFPMPQPKLW